MIKKTVRKVQGVESVSVNENTGVVEILCDSLSAREKPIIESIEKMGYNVLTDSLNESMPETSSSPHH